MQYRNKWQDTSQKKIN